MPRPACTRATGALLGVYTGSSLDELTQVAADAGSGSTNGCYNRYSEVEFEFTAGTEYRIAIDGRGGAQSSFALHLEGPPANDDFANAQEIYGGYFPQHLYGSNRHATREEGEPQIEGDSGGASVWYSWTPTSSGTALLSACMYSSRSALLGAYTSTGVGGSGGSAVGAEYGEAPGLESLIQVAAGVANGPETGCLSSSKKSEATLEFSSGTTYYIAVDGEEGTEASFELTIESLSAGTIVGTVTAAASHEALPGASVCAYGTGGSSYYRCASTGEAGGYAIPQLPAGEYKVEFFPGYDCGEGGCTRRNYVRQYYDAEPSYEAADPVTVEPGETSTGIDAELVAGGRIRHDDERGDRRGARRCVGVRLTRSAVAKRGPARKRTKGANMCSPPWKSGEYKVEFYWPSIPYGSQYYDGVYSLEGAQAVSVVAGETTPGIDAELHELGKIEGVVTDAVSGEPIEGIQVCAYRSEGPYGYHCVTTGEAGGI